MESNREALNITTSDPAASGTETLDLAAWDPATLRDRALRYAAHGVRVFPCAPGGKTPLTRNGFHDATTDPGVIAVWWERHPSANVATPTGAPGFDVLDVDVRPNGSGWGAFNRATRAGLLTGWLRAVETPSGGLHLHFPGSDQPNGSLRGEHVDFRGHGGYVLLPPSHVQAETYAGTYTLVGRQPPPRQVLNWAAVTALIAPPASAPLPRFTPGADPTGASPLTSPGNPKATATTPCSGPPAEPPKPKSETSNRSSRQPSMPASPSVKPVEPSAAPTTPSPAEAPPAAPSRPRHNWPRPPDDPGESDDPRRRSHRTEDAALHRRGRRRARLRP